MLYMISQWHLFYNWKFHLPHLVHLSPHPPPLQQLPVCSLFAWVCFCFVIFVHLFWFSDSTCRWNHTVFVCHQPTSLSIKPSGSCHVIIHGKISFSLSCFLMLSNSLVCVCVFVYILDKISSIAQSCPTLCDPMDCSTPCFPVHHQLLELPQIHIHWVGDKIYIYI